MPNVRNLKLEVLRKRCKAAGLPTSGNRLTLIERLEDYGSDEVYESFQDAGNSGLLRRIDMLEKSIQGIQLAKGMFQPTTASSPTHPICVDDEINQAGACINVTTDSSNTHTYIQRDATNTNVFLNRQPTICTNGATQTTIPNQLFALPTSFFGKSSVSTNVYQHPMMTTGIYQHENDATTTGYNVYSTHNENQRLTSANVDANLYHQNANINHPNGIPFTQGGQRTIGTSTLPHRHVIFTELFTLILRFDSDRKLLSLANLVFCVPFPVTIQFVFRLSKNTTPEQYEKLASLMATKDDIASGYHKRPKEEVEAFWEEVANALNAIGPPIKTDAAWKKVWIDWKSYIKRKLTTNKKEMMSTGGGNCRLQRISHLEEKVIQLTGLVTSTSGISGTVDFGVASEMPDDTRPTEMDISARSEDLADVATTSKRRQQLSTKENTSSLLKEQITAQKEFHNDVRKFNETILKRYDEMSTHLRRINRSLEKQSDIAAQQLEEQRRHNKIKEELLKKKVEIKLRMLKLEHPSSDLDSD